MPIQKISTPVVVLSFIFRYSSTALTALILVHFKQPCILDVSFEQNMHEEIIPNITFELMPR